MIISILWIHDQYRVGGFEPMKKTEKFDYHDCLDDILKQNRLLTCTVTQLWISFIFCDALREQTTGVDTTIPC